MNWIVRLCTFFCLLLLLAGCYEETQRITLNPDGSGKSRVEIVRAVSLPMKMGEEQESDFEPQEVLVNTSKAIIEKAKGVDAWQDVSFKYRDDGRMVFRGTAYFTDLSLYKINAQAGANSSGGGDLMSSLALRRGSSGLELVHAPAKKEGKAENKDESVQTKQDIFKERIKYQQMRGLLVATLSGMRVEHYIELPAPPQEYKTFQLDGQVLHYAVTGDRLLGFIDKIVTDPQLFEQLVKDGGGSEKISTWAQRQMYGGDLYARIEGEPEARFNYAREVKKVQKKWAKKKDELFPSQQAVAKKKSSADKILLDDEIEASNPQVSELKLFFLDKESARGLQLYGQERNMEMELVADLPVPLSDVAGGQLTRAVAADGSNLLSESGWGQRISFPKVSKDGRTIQVKLPKINYPKDFDGRLQELAGEVTGVVTRGEKVVDLGLIETREGGKGSKYDATVTKLDSNSMKPEREDLWLKLDLEDYFVIDCLFEDEKGAPLEVESTMRHLGKKVTMVYSYPRPWPEKVRVKLKTFEETQESKVLFSLGNIDLKDLLAGAEK